jgi:hypothetical protein
MDGISHEFAAASAHIARYAVHGHQENGCLQQAVKSSIKALAERGVVDEQGVVDELGYVDPN